MAALYNTLHFTHLSGAMTLSVLHWTKYCMCETSNDATTMRFIANFHELLMQAFTVGMLLYFIRT